MKTKNYMLIAAVSLAACPASGCREFLDAKPDQRLTVPSDLSDLQALLDNIPVYSGECVSAEIGSDDYYVTDADLASLTSDWHRRTYTWEPDNLFQTLSTDWNAFGTAVYYCNSVLEHLKRMERTASNRQLYDNIRGVALHTRGRKLFQASLIWTMAYDERTAPSLPGLPLRTGINFNEPSVRADLRETFDFLIGDLKASIPLLPDIPAHVVSPSKPAAYAMLARVFLYMGDYRQASLYADSCLSIKNGLLDYNDIDPRPTYPIPQYNGEVILSFLMNPGQILNLARGRVNPGIIDSYSEGDLRANLFFAANPDGSKGFRGRYSGGLTLFAGLATDEVYLIRAECNARLGNPRQALADLNHLLYFRYRKEDGQSTYVSADIDQADDVLEEVLGERRKQLIFRGLRWYDLKRLNRDGAGIELVRESGGRTYRLPPNDPRYALPLPEDVIALSGMVQNPR